MLGGSGAGILRRAGEWADIVHLVPQLGKAGTTTMEEIAKFSDAAVARKLARVRAAEAAAGRAAGATRFATTIFNFVPTASPSETAATAEALAPVFGVTPEEIRRHPVSLLGTPEEMIDEIRRREEVHGLSMLAVNFPRRDQVRTFGERVVAKLA
jgi:alkanesulfonate monooxygenase SsuD/methylene tetrahydromethanopterin reductase-like flavin-dependent oxidoreductase (luciferase family)